MHGHSRSINSHVLVWCIYKVGLRLVLLLIVHCTCTCMHVYICSNLMKILLAYKYLYIILSLFEPIVNSIIAEGSGCLLNLNNQ